MTATAISNYFVPKTIDEALTLLNERDAQTSISTRRITEFKQIEKNEEGLLIGSNTTLADLAQHETTAQYTALAQALATISDRHLLNHRTIGETLQMMSSDSSAVAASLLALDASVITVGVGSKKEISLSDFLQNDRFKGSELLAYVKVPLADNGDSVYENANFLSGSKPVCGIATGGQKSGNSALRIVLSGCNKVPMRLLELENVLAGKELNASTVEAGLEKIKDEQLLLRGDLPIGEDYLHHLIKVLIRKAILKP